MERATGSHCRMHAQKRRPLLESAPRRNGVVDVKLPVPALEVASTDTRFGLDRMAGYCTFGHERAPCSAVRDTAISRERVCSRSRKPHRCLAPRCVAMKAGTLGGRSSSLVTTSAVREVSHDQT